MLFRQVGGELFSKPSSPWSGLTSYRACLLPAKDFHPGSDPVIFPKTPGINCFADISKPLLGMKYRAAFPTFQRAIPHPDSRQPVIDHHDRFCKNGNVFNSFPHRW